MSRAIALRASLATIFEDEEPRGAATRVFNVLLAALIIVNVVCVLLESVESIRHQFFREFLWFERVATGVFAVEYVLRVWASVDFQAGSYKEPFRGRLRYMRSFFALIDLIAVLPAILGLLGASDFRVIRLLRLLRMLKLVRHSKMFGLLAAVLRDEARSIAALLFILLLTVITSGALMYMFEGEEQPLVFSSIPAAMWWATETLTTVGYGDMVPMTVAGKLLGGMVSIIGIGTLALFSGVITIAFLEELRKHRARLAGGDSDVWDLAEPDLETELPSNGTVPFRGVCPRCGFAHPQASAPLAPSK